MSKVTALKQSKRHQKNTDEVLVGIDYPLIGEGSYEAVLVTWETSSKYSKKNPDNPSILSGGKIYLHWHIDPYNNAGLGNDEIIVFMPFNANTLHLPLGDKGRFTAGRRSKYGKLIKKQLGRSKSQGSAYPDVFFNKLFEVNVRTVISDEKQQPLSEDEQYSVVDTVIGLA